MDFVFYFSSEDAPYARRSSGGLLSPPLEHSLNLNSSFNDSDQHGFYLLKKDSQRRATLVQVINEDAHSICKIWVEILKKSVQDLILRVHHLQNILLPGLRDFIPQQNNAHIQDAIASLKEEFDFDGSAINQIQLALLTFQEAVNMVLRNHSIKPHWMFALDNLVRSAVQAGITILSPELGENIAGTENRDRDQTTVIDVDDQDRESTSGVSTVASNKSNAIRGPSNSLGEESLLVLQQKNESLKAENLQLWHQLIETQETLREMIKSNLNETKLQLHFIQQHQFAPIIINANESIGNGSSISSASALSSQRSINKVNGDIFLIRWLNSLELDEESIQKVRY